VKFTKLHGSKFIWFNTNKYRINWDKESKSKFQYNVKQFLRTYWQNDVVCEEMRIPGSLLRIDLINLTKKIAIEISGPQHENFHYFHNNSRLKYLRQIKNDTAKQTWIEKNGFKFCEIFESDLPLKKQWFEEKKIYL